VDSISPGRRRENMRQIKSKGMKPEMAVRRIVHRLGFRYRLHVADLPGKPDLVFRRLNKVIEVRGCFWHRHGKCIDSHIPKSRIEYWGPKLERNRVRDAANLRHLKKLGFKVLVVWECEVPDEDRLTKRLTRFLTG
jgi:DNA mismatch endonuclease (patch repair protein)